MSKPLRVYENGSGEKATITVKTKDGNIHCKIKAKDIFMIDHLTRDGITDMYIVLNDEGDTIIIRNCGRLYEKVQEFIRKNKVD